MAMAFIQREVQDAGKWIIGMSSNIGTYFGVNQYQKKLLK